MAIYNGIYSVIVPATAPNFTAHTYYQIYAGAGATPVINGVSVTMAAGSILNLNISSISNGTGCYLIGENYSVSYDTPCLNC